MTILFLGVVVSAQDSAKLNQITKIYVDRLGDEESSDLVREKIKIRIVKSKRFTLVEDADNPDAILTGSAGTQPNQWLYDKRHRKRENSSYRRRGFSPRVAKVQRNNWACEYKPGFFPHSRNASGSVADKVIDKLLKDAKKAEKGK